MRVLLIPPSMHPRQGGPPRIVYGTALALARAGVDVEIATIGFPGEDAETIATWPRLAEAGVTLRIFPIGFPHVIGRSGELVRFLKEQGAAYDLLHIHCIWETGLADAAAAFRAMGKPVLVSCHGMLDRWQMQRSAWKKTLAQRFLGTGAMLREADALLYGSEDEAGEARPLGFPSRVAIMPNGVDMGASDGTAEGRERLLARFPEIGGWTRTVLFFSRLHPKKGLDLLVEAFGRVHRDFPGIGLLAAAIAQDEDYGARIRARIAELQPMNVVLVTESGGLKAPEAFAVADIFCLPSHQEGFSMAILEAASAGLPELITDKCHIPEIQEEGAGFVVDDTVDAIEQGLRRLLAMDDASLTEMGANGRRLIAERFTWDKIAERLIVAYGEAIAGKRAAA